MPTEPEPLEFHTFLANKLRDRNYSLKKLSENSGIMITHLERLVEGDYKKLPPAPYLRGYLKRLGEILEFDHEFWWEKFSTLELVQSGLKDGLPQNRFAIETSKRYLWIGALLLAVTFYVGTRFGDIIGRPALSLAYPESSLVESTVNPVQIIGTVNRASEVKINREGVPLDQDGNFSKEITLEPGLNTIEVKAKKFLGQEVTLIRQILYKSEPPPIENPSSTASSTSPN